MVRLIFLDLDGVLNSDAWYDGFMSRGDAIPRPPIDRAAVARLERIVQATGAHIVLSTSWRGDPRLPLWLLQHGCSAAVVGRTPRLPGTGERVNVTRGTEIASWLRRRARCGVAVQGFCILDDGDDMGALAPWLVQTTQATGLQDEHVGRAITLLVGAENPRTDEENGRMGTTKTAPGIAGNDAPVPDRTSVSSTEVG